MIVHPAQSMGMLTGSYDAPGALTFRVWRVNWFDGNFLRAGRPLVYLLLMCCAQT